MNSIEKTKERNDKKAAPGKYYACERCGYVTIIRDSYCPICAKDGVKVKTR